MNEDPNVWLGWNDQMWPRDSGMARSRRPENFYWSCCQDALDSEGCELTFHVYKRSYDFNTKSEMRRRGVFPGIAG